MAKCSLLRAPRCPKVREALDDLDDEHDVVEQTLAGTWDSSMQHANDSGGVVTDLCQAFQTAAERLRLQREYSVERRSGDISVSIELGDQETAAALEEVIRRQNPFVAECHYFAVGNYGKIAADLAGAFGVSSKKSFKMTRDFNLLSRALEKINTAVRKYPETLAVCAVSITQQADGNGQKAWYLNVTVGMPSSEYRYARALENNR